jgi:hypothetical protein
VAELDGSILVVHHDRKAQRVVERVLGATLRPVILVDSGDAALALRDGTPSLLVISSRLRAAPSGELLLERARIQGCTDVIVLHDGPSPTAAELFDAGGFEHLVSSTMPVLAEELAITAAKLLRRDVFGLEKYLAWGAVTRETIVTSTTDRLRAVASVAASVESMHVGRRQQQAAELVTDELVLNAIHHAPVDARGQRYLAAVPRGAAHELVGRERPRLRWGCDGRVLAIEVTDSFGTLDAATTLAYVARCLGRPGAVRAEGEGSGIGLAMAFTASSQLVFNVEPGRRTQVIAVIDVRPWPSRVAADLPSLHLFHVEPA